MTQIIIAIITPVLTALCSLAVSYVTLHKNRNKVDRVLLRQSLRNTWTIYRDSETIPHDVYTEFCEVYDLYAALGGNGTAKKMKQEIDTKRLEDGR